MAGVLAFATASPARAADPAPSSETLARAAQAGRDYLLSTQGRDGRWKSRLAEQFPGGPDALAAVALLSTGLEPNHPKLVAAIEAVTRSDPQTVYARAMRTLLYARLGTDDARRRLAGDVVWLAKQQAANGGWGYGSGHPTNQARPTWVDNSNSQFALLALLEAAEAGASVPDSVWKRARDYWQNGQNPDGGWGYEPRGISSEPLRAASYGSMSAAGAASLLSLLDRMPPAVAGEPGTMFGPRDAVAPVAASADKAMNWLTANFAADRLPKWIWGGQGREYLLYYHHALARTADLAGLRRLGKADWRGQIAAWLIKNQRPDGSWAPQEGLSQTGPDVETAMALLVLARCRQPVVLGRLEMDSLPGPARPDAANVCQWLRRVAGVPATWQRVDANDPPEVLDETPTLLIPANGGIRLSEALGKRLADYVRGGGTILIQCPPGQEEFANSLAAHWTRLLPGYVSRELGPRHPLWSTRRTVTPAKMIGISDGYQDRVLLAVEDVAGSWAAGLDIRTRDAFGLFENLLAYATAGAMPTERMRQPLAVPRSGTVVAKLTVRRLTVGDGWSGCPDALKRMHSVLGAAVSIGVDEQRPANLGAAVPSGTDLLWWAGEQWPKLPDDQARRLREYLDGGGMIFLDGAGRRETLNSALAGLRDLLGSDRVAPLEANDPLFTGRLAGGAGADVSSPRFTPAAADHDGPLLYGGFSPKGDGRPVAVVSTLAITCPVQGLPAYGCRGLATDDARRLAANILILAAQQANTETKTP